MCRRSTLGAAEPGRTRGGSGSTPASGFGFCFPLGRREGCSHGILSPAAVWLWQEPGAEGVPSLPGCGCRWQERRVVGGFFYTIYCSHRPEDGASTLLRPRPSHILGLSAQGWREKAFGGDLWALREHHRAVPLCIPMEKQQLNPGHSSCPLLAPLAWCRDTHKNLQQIPPSAGETCALGGKGSERVSAGWPPMSSTESRSQRFILALTVASREGRGRSAHPWLQWKS